MKKKWQNVGLRLVKLLLVILLFSTIVSCGKANPNFTGKSNTPKVESGETSTTQKKDLQSDSKMQVHYIDVGQGDATLISCDEHFMLIDAGKNDKGSAVCDYLKQQGISNLDYVIGTHPDADHIGGLDVVIQQFNCGKVFLSADQKDTITYRDVQNAIKEKGYQSSNPSVGSSYALGGAEFTVVGPSKNAKDANDNSIALILHHGKNSFYFEGDAQEEEEKGIVATGIPIDATVYKIGHHGSNTSTSDRMLDAVKPSYAVISVGENSYGHPNAEVLNKLRAKGVQLFRTDEQGTIVATSDGAKISWNCTPTESWQAGEATGSSTANTEPKDVMVHITKTGNKYHVAGCEHLKGSDTEILLSKAKEQGYKPCGVCHPPK
jgi:competence protein ComEC